MSGPAFRLADLVPRDGDLSHRVHRLDTLRRVLNGTIYDVLGVEFEQETNEAKEYIPIRLRRPSVRWNLCRIATLDSIALLFGRGRFPKVVGADTAGSDAIAAIIADCGLATVMADAALRGSIGSAALRFRVLDGRVCVDAFDSLYLIPDWDPKRPDTLRSIVERYKVKGAALSASGYAIPENLLSADHWFMRQWDATDETWFVPQLVSDTRDGQPMRIDPKRSMKHGLGFCPWVWVRNLPGGDDVDGACTFEAGIATQIEVEYLLSQSGRGLKYSCDPLLLIKEPALPDGPIIRSSANALLVDDKGDARLIEMTGSGSEAVIEHVRMLRHAIMEAIGGSRGDPDKMTAAQSGRAMELLHQPLIWLADKLRSSYGEALLSVVRMIVAASATLSLETRQGSVSRIAATDLSLRWPDWFEPTWSDQQAKAIYLTSMIEAGVISRETATSMVAADCGIVNVAAERKRIAQENVPPSGAKEAVAEARETIHD